MNESQETDFKIGEWWVRPRRNELERGEEAVCVEGRSMAVLVCLARHAPNVVSRERLLEEVWADSPFIGDEVVSHSIWELRKTLGDSAQNPSYIRTIPRKGYLLLQEVLRPQGSPLPIEGVQIDHYDIQEELGRGSMGVVYKAVDRRLGRTVAIKFLAPELTRDLKARQRFQREARLAASLDHPNLATVHEIGETKDGHQYLVTAYYSGGSLQDKLACGSFTVEESLSLARQLAAGLGAAHQREIIHRDIKPANLLLDDHGTLKIADFGIAKLQSSTQLTRTGASLGTPAYKSPEQAEGLAVDHRTDLWSLGVVLFELLTGHRPFPGEYELAVVHSILSKEPEPLLGRDGQALPDEVRRIVGKAMAKDRERRYQSAEELIGDLDGVGGGVPTRPVRSRGYRLLVPVTVGVLVLASVVFTAALIPRLGAPAFEKATTTSSEPEKNPRSLVLDQAQKFWLRGNDPGNLLNVEKLLKREVERDPNSADGLAHLAMFYAEKNSLRKIPAHSVRAAYFLERALEKNPASSLALAAKARLSVERGQWKSGELEARRAMEMQPHCERGDSCDFAYVVLGEVLWKQGDREKALEVLEKGAQEGGGFIRCHLKKAQLYDWSHELEEAERAYLEVLNIEPGQTTALNELGIILSRLSRFDESNEILGRLFEQTLDPNAAVNLGNAFYGLKNWPEAISWYKKADEVYQESGELVPTPLVNIGDVNLEMGDTKRAKAYFRAALETFERLASEETLSARRESQFAVCLAKAGDLDKAEQKIQEVLRVEAVTGEILRYATQIYALRSERPAMCEYATQAIQKGMKPNELLTDPAFIAFRTDDEYRQCLGLPVLEGE